VSAPGIAEGGIAALLPEPPARVLEVGCGRGQLALALRDAGYDVLAIDPLAPHGEPFLRVALEDLGGDVGEFDAVVAQRSLHHLQGLRDGVGKIAELAARIVVDDFGWELIDESTGEWYEGRRREFAAAGRAPSGPPLTEWEQHHRGLHGFEAMRSELAKRFVGRRFEPQPYLYRYLGGDGDEELERSLIAARVIRPLGFRWVGTRR
jgi:SAM-dependent methyltransferase